MRKFLKEDGVDIGVGILIMAGIFTVGQTVVIWVSDFFPWR